MTCREWLETATLWIRSIWIFGEEHRRVCDAGSKAEIRRRYRRRRGWRTCWPRRGGDLTGFPMDIVTSRWLLRQADRESFSGHGSSKQGSTARVVTRIFRGADSWSQSAATSAIRIRRFLGELMTDDSDNALELSLSWTSSRITLDIRGSAPIAVGALLYSRVTGVFGNLPVVRVDDETAVNGRRDHSA